MEEYISQARQAALHCPDVACAEAHARHYEETLQRAEEQWEMARKLYAGLAQVFRDRVEELSDADSEAG